MKTICAWCQKEANEKPEPGQSHGICQRHKREMLIDLAKDKLENATDLETKLDAAFDLAKLSI